MRQRQRVRKENMTPDKLEDLFEGYMEGVEDAKQTGLEPELPNMAGFAVYCGMGISSLGEFFRDKAYHDLYDYIMAHFENETVKSGVNGKNQTWHIFYSKNRLGYKDEQTMKIENTGYNEKLKDKSDDELLNELKEVKKLLAGEEKVPDEVFDVDYETTEVEDE